jgi:hypothetical protein
MSHLNAEGEECEIESPHFVPPMGDTLGFYSCNVPEDIRNHGRCLPPFDHQHYQHHLTAEGLYVAPEERARRRAEREPARGWDRAEIKNLGRSRVASWNEIVVAARELLDRVASESDPVLGWSAWPAEYGKLARACDWTRPAGWPEETEENDG